MKNILLSCCMVFLVAGCGKFRLLETSVPGFKVTKDNNRIILKYNQSVTVRPSSGTSPNFTTTLPSFENIASVLAPESASSYGTVQATATVLSGNYLYIAYNTAGDEVFGAIDVINIADPSNPYIEYTYSSDEYEFSDLKIKGNHLYLSGYQKENTSHSPGAILMIVDVTSKSSPVISSVQAVTGTYATSIDLLDSQILINTGTVGGLQKYDISNPSSPVLISSVSRSNGLYAKLGGVLDFALSGSSDTKFEAINGTSSYASLQVVAQASESPSRFVRQNSLVYMNNAKSGKLHILDLSHVTVGQISEISSLPLLGTANGLAMDQQKIYAAQGEKGLTVVNVANPATPQNLGNVFFQEDSGSINNVWMDKNNAAKFLFVASGRTGLKILKEVVPAPVQSNQISFYARSQDYDGSAKVVVKVNGQVLTTITVSGSDYTLYTVNNPTTLSSNDIVDLVFINDKYDGTEATDRNAMVAYLKINDNYCYLSPVGNNDLGLFAQYQMLSASEDTCVTSQTALLCSPGADKVPAQSCPLTDNHQGKLVCDSTGLGYECVDSGSCVAGYTNIGGTCQQVVCQSGQTQDCSDSTSVKQQTCNASGTAYGTCEFVSCQPNYVLIGGSCVPQACSPNSTASCSVANGSGTKTCDAQGTGYGSCTPTSCNAGYYLNGGICVEQTCNPGSTQSCTFMHLIGSQTCDAQGAGYGSCQTGTTCEAGYHYLAGICVQNACTPNSTASCSIANGTGSQTCDSQGAGYGSCTVTSCNAGFYQSGNSCIAQTCTPNSTQSCVSNHLVGTQTCNAQGSSYGSCQTGTTCESGFFYDNGSCSPQICTPNSSTPCNENNGSGTKTCNTQGSAYGSCVITSCNAGFYLNNGSCVPQACSPNSTQSCVSNHIIGTQTCSANGSSFGSCQTGTTCEAGYYYSNGSCLPQSCTPNSSISCNENNGSGTKQCNSQGSSYGSCQITSCNSGFYLDNGSCVAQVCSPNSSQSCSVPNGSGTKQCNAQGSAFGSCSLVSCDPGFYNNNGVCTAQVCTPNSSQSCVSNHLVGTQTCNANGSAIGSCQTGTTCEAGYFYNNGVCSPQVCSPNSTSSCSVPNGSGTQTCNAQGSAYGSCTMTSCNAGFYNNNGVCATQICTPSSTASCVDNHLVGTKQCNVQGSAYGSCVTGTTCESGYYYSNGSCLPQVCSPNSTSSCSSSNGSGLKTCNAQGSDYGSCVISACDSGYTLVGGSCVPQVCSPNSTASCSSGNGTGTKTCNANGTAYGSCTINSCNAGFYLSNGSCVAQVCSPSSTAACSITNGTGTKTCNAQGSDYGSCAVTSCNAGYVQSGNTCIANPNACSVPNGSGTLTTFSGGPTVYHELTNDWGSGYSYLLRLTNNTSTQIQDWSVCFSYNYNVGNLGISNTDIDSNYTKPNWRLTPKSYNKIIYPGSNVTINWNASPGSVGTNRLQNIKVFNSSSASCDDVPVYSSSPVCVATSCNSGYHLESNKCQPNTKSCSVSNGIGTQTWNGTGYGACSNVVCDHPGYAFIDINLSTTGSAYCAPSCPLGLVKIKISNNNFICL